MLATPASSTVCVKYGRLNPYATDPGQAIADEKIREDRVRDQQLGMSRWVWAGLAPTAPGEDSRADPCAAWRRSQAALPTQRGDSTAQLDRSDREQTLFAT